ncbi:hypothetical protein KKZ03_14135 [Methylobacter sp. S3L5C]|nr:hypothetical protein KKZ03_14135 [Methylobacter sp. S3L5C]
MKSTLPYYTLLISAVLNTGCTHIAPSATVSEAVIESILPSTQPEKPWRLDSAWQGGRLGGSALRGSSIEHVIRQVDNKPSSLPSASRSTDIRLKPVPRAVSKPDCKPDSVLK